MRKYTINITAYVIISILVSVALFSSCALTNEVPTEPAATPTQPPQEPDLAEQVPDPDEFESKADRVAIYLGNDIYAVVPFDTADIVTVNQGNGKINEVTLTGHSVYMSHSTCDNQDCVKQGAITLENRETRILMDWVICLPNQVTIEFVPGDKE